MLKLKIPPPVYLATFMGLVWLCHQYFPLYVLIPETARFIGLIIIAIFASLDLWSVLLFFKSKTTINPLVPKNSQHLVTSGMYQISRNPMYLGLAFILLGWAIHLGSLSGFLLLPLFVLVLTIQQIKPEEVILEEKFGETYLQYKNQVRRWI